MRAFGKCLAATVSLALLCGTAPPARAAVPAGAVPRPVFPATDLGRRAASAPVDFSLTLRYNHPAELAALVAAQADRRSPLYHRFLTSAQFDSYFAPTARQEAAVVAALRAGGLAVTRAFPNRTVLDARGPSASVERFFGTRIHTFAQGRFGTSFANVAPARMPSALAPLVQTVDLSGLIVARAAPRLRPAPPAFSVPAYIAPLAAPAAANFLSDPGFESGAFGHGWNRCERRGTVKPLATITAVLAHSGRYSARTGSSSKVSGEQLGYAGVCQLVKIPPDAVLSAYLYQLTDETSKSYAGQDVELLETDGTVAANLVATLANRAAWVEHSWNLAAYKGRELYVYFGVHGDGRAGHFTMQFIDDVKLTGLGPTPSPTPKPTTTPTAKPTPKPTPSPKPTAKPTATPRPTATPTQSACNAPADNGPNSNVFGYLAGGVAEAFDFPVQQGCNGQGQTIAVVIDSPVEQGDIDQYLRAAGVTQTGTVVNVPVDGGGTYSSAGGSETSESTLDVETISGLAPGAGVRVYDVPSLTTAHIVDAYDQAVSDDLAGVISSSFGGCESADTSAADMTEQIAEQGAAKGITFVAASGDTGSDECDTGNDPPGPATPASDPHVVAVGGVNFTENQLGLLTSIGAQGDTATGFLSGGGVSTYFAMPAYQSGVNGVFTSGRNTPDVSLPGVKAALYQAGNVYSVDGTSWSAPQFAALLAEASELHGGARWGWVNPAIYALFKSSGYADFTDVTTGNNGYYQAKAGYDQVTGIGAPQGYAFASAL